MLNSIESIKETKIKFCAISDLHGKLDFSIEECDYLLISGDICPDYGGKDQLDTAQAQFNWLCNSFSNWLIKQPILRKCLVTWGNHDFVGQQLPTSTINYYLRGTCNNKIEVLNGTSYRCAIEYIAKTINIHGYPWTPQFFNWAFNVPKHIGEAVELSLVPSDTHILISHGPPAGETGNTIKNGKEIKCGSADLYEWLHRTTNINLKHVVCGHIHGGHGKEDIFQESIRVHNCSLLDEQYNLTHPPYYFTMIYDPALEIWN